MSDKSGLSVFVLSFILTDLTLICVTLFYRNRQEEIQLLQQKMKEMEMNTSQDRLRRSKTSDESGHLVRENVKLAQRVQELKSQLGRVSVSVS